jgi:CheY-like chemotaxis protein
MAKILLIDDEAEIRDFLQKALEERGHEVGALASADSAPALLETVEFDLVLADVKLPGLWGTDLLKVLRKRKIGVAVILMTGFAPTPIIQEVEKLDAMVVSKITGGHDELWKELEPKLEEALQGEAEIRACLSRALDVAFKRRRKGIATYVQELLNGVLLGWALDQAGRNENVAQEILGIRLKDILPSKDDATPEARHQRFVMEALILIGNHLEWTVAAYASELGCSKARLYNDPVISDALKRRKGR